MAQRIDLIELREHFRRGDDLIVLHYGCESLYAATDHPASVSCIAFCRIGRADAGSFSVVDVPEGTDWSEAELGVLRAYFQFLQEGASAAFAHWNMSKADTDLVRWRRGTGFSRARMLLTVSPGTGRMISMTSSSTSTELTTRHIRGLFP